MGYSLKQSEFDKAKQGTEFTYFPDEEWNKYPFASEQDAKWFREAKYGLFLHVGISAIGMVDISWSRKTHKLPDPMWGSIVSDEEYDSAGQSSLLLKNSTQRNGLPLQSKAVSNMLSLLPSITTAFICGTRHIPIIKLQILPLAEIISKS